MKNLTLLLITALVLITGHARADLPGLPLKVLTLNFNSEIVPSDSDFRVRDSRFARISKWVEDNNPDIILLEEAWSYKADHTIAQTLARKIGYNCNFRLEMGFFNFFFEADAVLTKKTLNLKNPIQIKLPHSSFEAGDGKNWVIELGSVSYAVGGKIQLGQTPVYVYAVHFTGATSADRADQASAVVQDAKNRAALDGIKWENANVLVGGDFNSSPIELGPKALIAAGFIDTFSAVHPGDPSCSLCEVPTGPQFDPASLASGQFPSQASDASVARVDYIFSHGPQLKPVASTLTFTSPLAGVWMSDHYGVTSVFGNKTTSETPNPVRDSEINIPPPSVLNVVSGMTDSPSITVQGSRGFVVTNKSKIPIRVNIVGSGNVYLSRSEWLMSGEQSSFAFGSPGNYSYIIWTYNASIRRPEISLQGPIQVLHN